MRLFISKNSTMRSAEKALKSIFQHLLVGGVSNDVCNHFLHEPVCRQQFSNSAGLCHLASTNVVWPNPLESMLVVRRRPMVSESGRCFWLLRLCRDGCPKCGGDDQVLAWGQLEEEIWIRPSLESGLPTSQVLCNVELAEGG